MRFKNYLTELFKERKDFDITTKKDDFFEGTFEVDNTTFEFEIAYFKNEERWEAFFENKDVSGPHSMEITKNMKEKAIEVYSYIVSVVKHFLRKYKPHKLYIEGMETQQDKLYKKLVSRFEKEIKSMGYEIISSSFDSGITIDKEQ